MTGVELLARSALLAAVLLGMALALAALLGRRAAGRHAALLAGLLLAAAAPLWLGLAVRRAPAWNQDHDLASTTRTSASWFFEEGAPLRAPHAGPGRGGHHHRAPGPRGAARQDRHGGRQRRGG